MYSNLRKLEMTGRQSKSSVTEETNYVYDTVVPYYTSASLYEQLSI